MSTRQALSKGRAKCPQLTCIDAFSACSNGTFFGCKVRLKLILDNSAAKQVLYRVWRWTHQTFVLQGFVAATAGENKGAGNVIYSLFVFCGSFLVLLFLSSWFFCYYGIVTAADYVYTGPLPVHFCAPPLAGLRAISISFLCSLQPATERVERPGESQEALDRKKGNVIYSYQGKLCRPSDKEVVSRQNEIAHA